jgi:cytosine/adenosine deaminase-related metal-dependent hydrolase
VSTLLIKHAAVLATMDDAGSEIADGGLYAVDGWIEQVGPSAELPGTADEVLDLGDHVVLPGLINTHHHFYQTLTRAVPGAQDAGLFDWLKVLYPIWARMTPEDVVLSTQVALAELALSGCTTSADHLYLYPNGSSFDDQVEAAQAIPLRVHLARGSMSLGESEGGLPPDSVVEDEDSILTDTQRVIEAFHDPERGAMVRVVVAPCSPFSVTTDLMREAADLARVNGVHLHTHVAETLDEEQFCFGLCGMRPVELMEDLGWAGDDVWYAHGVFVDEAEIKRMAAAGTGVAHCPSSNMRLASGIAPLRGYLQAGVRTGLGVDGSASNDGSHLLGEARQAMLLARLAATGEEGPYLSAREALRVATRGSAAVLGRDDVGSLEAGKAADFTAISLDRVGYAGALHDPVAAVLFAAPVSVDHTYVHGRAVVRDGEVVGLDLGMLLERHNAAARRLVG